jgi:hypothetical protein
MRAPLLLAIAAALGFAAPAASRNAAVSWSVC